MKTGVLIIHGFTGGHYEVRPLVEFLKIRTDWQISVPILPGHGAKPDLSQVTADSWLMAAELGIRQLQKEVDRIIVVGFSMGGLIAMYLGLRYKIDKLILLSAAAKYISPWILLKDLGILLAEPVKKYPPNTFYHLYNYKLRYTPLHATREFLRIVKLVEPYYSKIEMPVCLVQGKEDGIVPYETARYLYEQLGSKKKKFITSIAGKHHICYSEDCYEWFEVVLEFMNE